MHIVYISGTYDDWVFKEIFTKEKKPMQAANKYHSLLCKGLAENGVGILMLSSLPINRENCDKKIVRISERGNTNIIRKYMTIINIPFIKHLGIFIQTFFKTLILPRKYIVFYDVLTVSASYGAAVAAALSGKKKVAIVTDLPQYQPIGNNRSMLKINNMLLNMADKYVFLTEHMNINANKKNKPYIVVEGLVDADMVFSEHKDFDKCKKMILYAGSLKKIYGIDSLCNAFLKCADSQAELHIYGDGDYVPELYKLQSLYPNITYHGNCPNYEVVKAEQEAVVLVNPRPTEGEYTKYSFPSKTMEYMVSGTPVISARLAGIPQEYDNYLIYFDDKKKDDLAIKLRHVLNMTTEELTELGNNTRSFVINNKTNVMQANRIVAFLSGDSTY